MISCQAGRPSLVGPLATHFAPARGAVVLVASRFGCRRSDTASSTRCTRREKEQGHCEKRTGHCAWLAAGVCEATNEQTDGHVGALGSPAASICQWVGGPADAMLQLDR